MKKTVVILQPSYLPWIGYFNQIKKADTFVFFDDVQYTRRDWRNRNRIKTLQGEEKMLTVPVKTKGNYHALIKDIEINYQENWIASHLGIIQENYRATPYFGEIFPIIKQELEKKPQLLSPLNIDLTKAIADYLKIKTEFQIASELKIPSYQSPTDHLLQICKMFCATDYLTGDSAKAYMEENLFSQAGIKIHYHNYQHPTYTQIGKNFIAYLSIVDLLFNHGRDAIKIL